MYQYTDKENYREVIVRRYSDDPKVVIIPANKIGAILKYCLWIKYVGGSWWRIEHIKRQLGPSEATT